MLIKTSCSTAIDDFRGVDWPTVMVAVPRVGERVEGRRGNQRPTLKVVAVTHAIDGDGSPYIQVELWR